MQGCVFEKWPQNPRDLSNASSQFLALGLFQPLTTHYQTSLRFRFSTRFLDKSWQLNFCTHQQPLLACMQVPGTWFITTSSGGAKFSSHKIPWNRKRTMGMKADIESSVKRSARIGKTRIRRWSFIKLGANCSRLDACVCLYMSTFIWHYVLIFWILVLDWFSFLTLI